MGLIYKVEELMKQKTPVFINGLGIGKITNIEHNELLTLEIIKRKDKGTGKNKEKALYKEVIHIPITKIEVVSEGEKELPKTTTEKQIDDDLGDL